MIFQEPGSTAFDLRGNLFGVHVRVHPSFWLFAALFGWDYVRVGVPYLLLWILCMFVSILVHEFGHVLMGIWCGSWGHIVLYMMGGLAVGSNDVRKRWQRILVLLAGPAAGFLLYAAVYAAVIAGLLNALDPAGNQPLLWAGARMLLFMNLVWNLMNLVPVFPLDGGQVAMELTTGLSPYNGERIGLGISIVTGVAVAVYSFAARANPALPYLPIDPTFAALMFGFLALQNFGMLQQANQRRNRPWDDERF